MKLSSPHRQARPDSPQILQIRLVPSQRKQPVALIAAIVLATFFGIFLVDLDLRFTL
jgi:hypothetical protein